MPLLFSILEHCHLFGKQPNYYCGLFLFDLMFMVMTWARAIMSTSQKAWTFPGRPYYYTLHFQKLIESPIVRQKEERDIPGPQDNPEGKSCLGGSSHPMTLWSGYVLVILEGTYRVPGAAPCEEELPCRFLSHPMSLSRTGRILATPSTTPVFLPWELQEQYEKAKYHGAPVLNWDPLWGSDF